MADSLAGQHTGTIRGIALALVCLVLLGTMPVIANSRPPATEALSFALALSMWQFLFSLPILAMELRAGNRGILEISLPGSRRRQIVMVIVFTGALFGLATYWYVLGVEKAGASNAAVAMQAYPLFAILWEGILLKRHKTPLELLLTAFLVLALYYLGTGGTWRLTGLSPWFLIALGVPFLWSIAHVLIREELSTTAITPVQVTFLRAAVSTLFLLIVMGVFYSDRLGQTAQVLAQPMSVLMGLIYYLELIVWFHAMRYIDVSLASAITTPWPALTMLLSVIILGDSVAAYQWVTLVVVVACIYGLTLAGMRSTAGGPVRNDGAEGERETNAR